MRRLVATNFSSLNRRSIRISKDAAGVTWSCTNQVWMAITRSVPEDACAIISAMIDIWDPNAIAGARSDPGQVALFKVPALEDVNGL